jgi:RES domain-containing protein
MAESVALAVLENLVHMSRQDFPTGYVCIAAILPADVSIVTEQELRLRAEVSSLSAPSLGDWWIDSKETAVLQVTSSIVPYEHNFLLNPAHPDFAKITTEPPALFHFDRRLFD